MRLTPQWHGKTGLHANPSVTQMDTTCQLTLNFFALLSCSDSSAARFLLSVKLTTERRNALQKWVASFKNDDMVYRECTHTRTRMHSASGTCNHTQTPRTFTLGWGVELDFVITLGSTEYDHVTLCQITPEHSSGLTGADGQHQHTKSTSVAKGKNKNRPRGVLRVPLSI